MTSLTGSGEFREGVQIITGTLPADFNPPSASIAKPAATQLPELDPEILQKPGYVLTSDRHSCIALCGGWEMSLACGRGDQTGQLHEVDWHRSGVADYWCAHCQMPLHPIGSVSDFQLMSIEPHVIEEIPW